MLRKRSLRASASIGVTEYYRRTARVRWRSLIWGFDGVIMGVVVAKGSVYDLESKGYVVVCNSKRECKSYLAENYEMVGVASQVMVRDQVGKCRVSASEANIYGIGYDIMSPLLWQMWRVFDAFYKYSRAD